METAHTPEARGLSLVTKLAEVQSAVKRVKKRGRNDFHKYDYATEADIVETVRHELATRHVMLIPEITSYTLHELPDKGGKSRDALMILNMAFTFEDGDSGERITKPWLGVGQDAGDKGCYKAMTGAEKYFILKTFLIPTGDDPERTTGPETRKATVQPDRDTRKARPKLDTTSGAVYIEKLVPREKGNMRWQEVVVSTGESYPVQEHKHQLIGVLTELAQGTQPVVLETHQNAKGKTELDGVRSWPEAVAAQEEPAPVVLTAGDIPF